MLLVESALILLYFFSNSFSNHYNIEAVRDLAEKTVKEAVNREASSINQQLRAITSATDYLSNHTKNIMTGLVPSKVDSPENYRYTDDGIFYSVENTGRGALFYSGVSPVDAEERQKAYISAGLDSAYNGIMESYPLVVQLYYNTYDSMNRIFPFFDVLEQYEAKANIPDYNFYYEADAKNNPNRKVVWTDVYVDPAGQGWMTSAIAPVYKDDFLEGVVGVDITVSTIIEQVLNIEIPWGGYGLLIGRDGTIIAMPKQAEPDWSLNELTTYDHTEVVTQDTFKPEAFNLYKRLEATDLSGNLKENDSGLQNVVLVEPRILAWATIPETGWKLLVSVPDKHIFQTANDLADRLNIIAWFVVASMVVFYMVFFTILYYRAKKMSDFVSKPLEDIDKMTQQISNGNYSLIAPTFSVTELSKTAHGIQKMGADVEFHQKLTQNAEKALADINSRLQAVFDLSPDGFVTMDSMNRTVLVNPAFCDMTGTKPAEWIGLTRRQFWGKLKSFAHEPENIRDSKESFTFALAMPDWRIIRCDQRFEFKVNAYHEINNVVFFNDITVSSELEVMKNNFLSSVAHELRTPLTSVMGYAELLYSNKLDKIQHDKFLHEIIAESHNLVKLINDILTIAHIDSTSGKLPDSHLYRADSLIEDCVENHLSEAQRSRIKLQLDCSEVYVHVSSEFFSIIFKHIIENAIKFSVPETDIEVLTELSEDRQLLFIKVIDHGIGMTPAQLNFAFDRFWRADNTGKVPGTGLGLSIAKELAEKMDITMNVDSVLDEGTCITMIFEPIDEPT